jgi:hypothetical protein
MTDDNSHLGQFTCAAESFPAHSCQDVETQVAICGLAKVLQPPEMIAILTDILQTNL